MPDDGEDEVVVLLGQEVAATALDEHALAESLAGQSAGSQRDLRLPELIARAHVPALVAGRLPEQDVDTLLLIVVHADLIEDGQRGQSEHDDRKQMPRSRAGGEEHREEHRQQHQQRAQVGLQQDQDHRRDGHQEGGDQPAPPAIRAAEAQVARQRHHQCELHEFGRLNRERPQREPAPRESHNRHEGYVDESIHNQQRQQRQHRGIEKPGKAPEPLVARPDRQRQQAKPADEKEDLARRIRAERAQRRRERALRAGGRGRRVERHERAGGLVAALGRVDARQPDREQEQHGQRDTPAEARSSQRAGGHHRVSASTSSMIRLATGPATLPPLPPNSITTPMA